LEHGYMSPGSVVHPAFAFFMVKTASGDGLWRRAGQADLRTRPPTRM
jgi:hypothetical protein